MSASDAYTDVLEIYQLHLLFLTHRKEEAEPSLSTSLYIKTPCRALPHRVIFLSKQSKSCSTLADGENLDLRSW